MGDMDCNLLDSSANAGKDRLVEMLQSFSLSQYVTQPTYSSGSLLVVVICNSSDIIQRVHAFNLRPGGGGGSFWPPLCFFEDNSKTKGNSVTKLGIPFH